MADCVTCLPGPDCDVSDDLNLYSLDRTIFPFVTQCPVGSDCFRPGSPISMACCQNIITRDVPGDATIGEWNQIIGQMLAQCQSQAAFCPGTTPITPTTTTILYFNHQKSCSLTCPDGTPFTFIVPPGRFIAPDQSIADQMAQDYACSRVAVEVICLGSLPRCTCADVPYSAFLSVIAVIGNRTARWSITSGSLPTGLTIAEGVNTNGGTTISGTPTVPGTYTFGITATTPGGGIITKTFTIVVLQITTTSLPPFVIGVPYNYQLQVVGGSGNYAWKLASGSLPNGLTLSITGVISGTPI